MNNFVLSIKCFFWKCTFGPLQGLQYRFLLRFFPHTILDRNFVESFGYRIDWEHPRDINEKIQYLLINTDTREWSKLADKLLVREYVKERGLSDLLIPLYGVWKSAKEIDFSKLPQKFVLKCNHDSGSTRIIDKKRMEGGGIRRL